MDIGPRDGERGGALLPDEDAAGRLTRGAGAGRRRAPSALLVAALLVPLSVMAGGAWLSWRQAWLATEAEVGRASDAAAEYARRVFDGLLLRVDLANEVLRGLSDAEIRAREAELHARLRAIAERTREGGDFHLFVHDRDGRSLVSGELLPVPGPERSFMHRDFNTALRSPGAPSVFIGRVYVGEEIGTRYFSVARRRTGGANGLPPGAYDGVIVASVDVGEMARALRHLAGEAGDAIALVRTDGEVLARWPDPDRPPPVLIGPDSAMRAAMARGEEAASAIGTSTVDGRVRIAAYRRVPGWPVYASATRERATVIARWRGSLLFQLAFGGPATLALVGLAGLASRSQRRLQDANDGLERRVAQRTAALTRSVREQREVLASIGEVLYALDADGRLRFASDRALGAWARAEDVVGQALLDVFPEAAGSASWEVQRATLADRLERHVCVPSPVLGRWIEMDVYPAGDGGVTVAFRDVDDRRGDARARARAEAELRESEARFRLVAEDAPVMLWMGDAEGRCLYLNRQLREFWGVAEDDLAGFAWGTTLHPDDAPLLHDTFARGMESRTGFRCEARYRRADGRFRILLTEARPRFGPRGAFLGMIGVNVDVTDARAAETALRESEELRRLALDAAGFGAWELDLRTGEARRTERVLTVFGFGPEAATGTALAWHDRVHPEDRECLDEATHAVAAGQAETYHVEYRFRRSDGAWIWIESHARGVDADPATGVPRRMIGTSRDITARKAEEERRVLLAREVDHRAKNALAVVQAALRLTPRHDLESYARAVEGRVAALARAHTLLAQGRWEGAALRELVEGELAAFQPAADGSRRVSVEGASLTLAPGAAQALSMAIHELATNATKHGALGAAGGRVFVTWATDEEHGLLRLRWEERGGPPVAALPTRRGFGSRVLEATVRGQLGGKVAMAWKPTGLVCEIEVPLGRATERATTEVAAHF